MKKSRTKNKISGMTLIEVLIFSALLSILISTTINYLFAVQLQNSKLLKDIDNKQGGFMATTAIILLTTGIMAFAIVAVSSAAIYSDSVSSRLFRIQKSQNLEACEYARELIISKDYFFSGTIWLSDLGCSISR